MEYNKNVWRGNDVDLEESVDCYGLVYQYDGEDFNGYCTCGIDDDGRPNSFAPFSMSNETIDEYFEENGDAIAKMCGVTQDEMDYPWKMDALMSYYGGYEFMDSMYSELSRDELIDKIKDNWIGN